MRNAQPTRRLARLIAALAVSVPAVCASEAEEEFELELYTSPSSIELQSPVYPRSRQVLGKEGWVNLNFMIGPAGNPYEVVVTDSTGDNEFEKAAIRAVGHSTFEPAQFNGEPVDAGYSLKVTFALDGKAGASPAFVRDYRKLMKAIDASKRDKADKLVSRLESKAADNLYEDAYLHVAKFVYFERWGDKFEQLDSLERAVAYEKGSRYLPEGLYRRVMFSLLRLRIQTQNYAGALSTYRILTRQDLEENVLADLRSTAEQISALRSEGEPYSVPGKISDNYFWHFPLFRSKFSVLDVNGAIAEVKLRCDSRYVFFRFEENVEYNVSENSGRCTLQLLGDPETTFKLLQM